MQSVDIYESKIVANKLDDVYNEIGQKTSIYYNLTAKPSVESGIKFNVETGKAVIQKSGEVYDDVTLGVINQVNNVAPSLTSRYLNNPTALTNNTNDFISSALPGIPANNWAGGISWSAASAYYWEDTVDTVKKI